MHTHITLYYCSILGNNIWRLFFFWLNNIECIKFSTLNIFIGKFWEKQWRRRHSFQGLKAKIPCSKTTVTGQMMWFLRHVWCTGLTSNILQLVEPELKVPLTLIFCHNYHDSNIALLNAPGWLLTCSDLRCCSEKQISWSGNSVLVNVMHQLSNLKIMWNDLDIKV